MDKTIILIVSLLLFVACDQGAEEELSGSKSEKKIDAIDVYEPGQTAVMTSPGKNIDDGLQQKSGANDKTGSFDFTVFDDSLSITAHRALKRDVLLALADEYGFTLRMNRSAVNGEYTTDSGSSRLETVLNQLLDNVPYSLVYSDNSPSELPRVVSVYVGYGAQSLGAKQSEQILPRSGDGGTSLDKHFSLGFAYAGESGLLDKQPIVESAYSNKEDLFRAINEIDLNASGIRSLATLLRDSPDSAVRVEAVDSLSNSDAFGAHWLVLSALKDTDPKVVQAALEAVELWQDPSVVPYVTAIMQDLEDPESIELAEDIIEFNSDLDTQDYTKMSPEEIKELAKQSAMRTAERRMIRENYERIRKDRR